MVVTSRRVDELTASRTATVGRVFDRALNVIVGTLLISMVCIALLQVFMRYFLGSALVWPEELIRWHFLWLVFLGAASALRFGGHIRIDALRENLPPATRKYIDVLNLGLVAFVLGILIHVGWDTADRATVISPALGGMRLGLLYIAVPAGSALMLVNLMRERIDGIDRRVVAGIVILAALSSWPLSETSWPVLEGLSPSTVVMISGVVLMALGMPIAYAIILAGFLSFWAAGDIDNTVVVSRVISTIRDNFTLVAIPFFIFMGSLMNIGGMTKTLVDAATSMVGSLRGGLAQVNVFTSVLLGGLTGSSSADTASVTKTLVPEMERRGYTREFGCAVTTSSSLIANLLPPSIMLLIYAGLANVSVGALFMAGVLPALLVAGTLMITIGIVSYRGKHVPPPLPRPPLRDILAAVARALPALALPVLILGSLRIGVLTPTEAGAAAVLYTVVLGILAYRTLRPRGFVAAVGESARESSGVLLLIACSAPVAWLLIIEGIPQKLAAGLGDLADNMLIFLLVLTLFLLLVGLVLEAAPAMVILVPILIPVTVAAGLDPVHLGVIMVLNLMIGSLTPPVGALTFVSASIAQVPVLGVFRALVIFQVALVGTLLLLTFVPSLSLWLPSALGF